MVCAVAGMVFGAFAEAAFPVAEYKQVEYVEANGPATFPIGFRPTATMVSRLKFVYKNATGGVFYGSPGSRSGYRFFVAGSNTYFDYEVATTYSRISGSHVKLGTTNEYEVGNNYVKNLTTGAVLLSGGKMGEPVVTDDVRLMQGNDYGRVYYLKVYSDADAMKLAHDIVPVVSRSDPSAVGFFDLTAGGLFTNTYSSASAFAVGEATDRWFPGAIAEQTYDGVTPCRPAVSVYDNATGEEVDPSKYGVEYFDNEAVGTGRAVITGIGEYADRTFTVTFSIFAREDDTIAVLPIADQMYGGTGEVCPPVAVSNRVTGAMLESGDYDVSYADNADYGVAKAIVTGKGDYAGHGGFVCFRICGRPCVWLGGVNASAANAANWEGGTAPQDGDRIVVDERAENRDLKWDHPVACLGGWFQTNYSGTVTFALADGDGGVLAADGEHWLKFAGDVAVLSGEWTHQAAGANATTAADEKYRLNIETAGDLTVGADAAVNLDGAGFRAGKGPGQKGGIAFHGGFGFAGGTNCWYGSMRYPRDYGSGGQNSGENLCGGGAAHFRVAGTMRVDGTVSANGMPRTAGGNAGTASGGSVLIEAGDLAGAGLVAAIGGCESRANCGGGGRIAVHLASSNDFARWTGAFDASAGSGGSMTGFSGDWGNQHSGPGTIYLRTADQAVDEGDLVIRSSNPYPCVTASIPLDEEWTVGSLVFEGTNPRFWIPVGKTLIVKRDVKVRGGTLWCGDDILDWGSWVGGGRTNPNLERHFVASGSFRFDNSLTNEHAVEGLVKLENFGVEPGTALRFGTTEADVFSVRDGGTLKIDGTAGDFVRLLPEDGAETWAFQVAPEAKVEITYAAVSNSVASRAVNVAGGTDLGGNNENWSFSRIIVVGEEIDWTGAVDDDWLKGGNWSLGRAPVETDLVVVKANAPVMPTLKGAAMLVDKLTVETGAALSLGGVSLTVGSVLTVKGTLTATGTEVLTILGDADFAGGTYGRGTADRVVFGGDVNQVFGPGGNAFRSLRIEKSGGTLTFADGFTADTFGAYPTAPVGVVFAAGASYAAGDVFFDGGAGTIGIASSAVDQVFLLAVSKTGFFINVSVRDCDASGGVICRADSTSRSVGDRNVNWQFGSAFAIWKGGVSSDMTVAENWQPAGVPTAGTDVKVFANGGAVTLTNPSKAPLEFRSLELDGQGGTVALTTAGGLAVAQDVVVGAGATLTLDGFGAAKTTIGGDLTLTGNGVLTHSGNATAEAYKLEVEVAGDVAIGSAASIDAKGKGYQSGCSAYGVALQGTSFASTIGKFGPAEGGGYYYGIRHDANRNTYGSALDSFQIGPGYSGHHGGGAVKLTVGGRIALDGAISVDGENRKDSTNNGAGCGGSVLISAKALSGAGTISSDSIVVQGNSFNNASGGRIAIRLAEKDGLSSFTGEIHAYSRGSGGINYMWTMAQCGTVFTSVGGVEELRLDNGYRLVNGKGNGVGLNQAGVVMLPADLDGDNGAKDYRHLTLTVTGKTRMALSADITVFDLVVDQKGLDDYAKDTSYSCALIPTIDLNGHTLTVRSTKHRQGRKWADALERLVFDSSDEQTGKIEWVGVGTALIVK